MIKSGDLENRAFDTNEPKGAEGVHADLARVRGPGALSDAEQLAALRERIAQARALAAPEGIDPDVWVRVRDATLRALEAP